MKRILFLILLLVVTRITFAQEAYLWPIKGAEPGTDILSAPQGYIGEELNFEKLFIGAEEGAWVVAPTDGVIKRISVKYYQSLTSVKSYRCENSFNHTISMLLDYVDKSVNPKYLTGELDISIGRGKILHISGLVGDLTFKTGQRIRQGDTLGYVGYSYYKIPEPSLGIAISLNSKVSDPMSPFGIKSSFIPVAGMKPISSLTKAQAKEDFMICINALKEAYPGLYQVVTPAELEQFVAEIMTAIESKGKILTYTEVRNIIKRTVARIHDSHISMRPPVWEKRKPLVFRPQIYMGWINDTLYCTNATMEYQHLIGQRILSVNGISADSARKLVASDISGYDAKAQGYVDYRLAVDGFYPLFLNREATPTFDMQVELAGGQKLDIKGLDSRKGAPLYIANTQWFMNMNRHNGSYVLKKINPSTAYIGLSNFVQNQVEVEEIARFIKDNSMTSNLIIDVRNNGGGVEEVLEKLYSYIAGEPMFLQSYSKVNKRGGFECFKYAINYPVGAEIFPDFRAEAGRDGFYQYPEGGEKKVEPDSVVNYKGRVYVLTNENSASAATLFPALLVRNHRGVVVGRETRTAYHFMNAMKFVEICLPNSKISVRIPLVGIYFDTVANPRIPFGRGVIPDYEVPLTLDEINYTHGDAILNYTLALIEQGRYFVDDNPDNDPELMQASDYTTIIVVFGLICIVTGALAIYIRKKRTHKRR